MKLIVRRAGVLAPLILIGLNTIGRPGRRRRDRLFWAGLSNIWSGWRSALVVVRPETVIRWHRQGFRWWWRGKSQAKRQRRPPLAQEIQTLIQRMTRDNPTWGAPRIQAELRLLGYEVAEASVAKYRPSQRKLLLRG